MTAPIHTRPSRAAGGSRLLGVGSYQPSRTLDNEELSRLVETSDEWIRTRVGIRERRIADTETVADMAIRAGQDALGHAGISAGDLDLIVVATTTAQDRSPSTAGRVSAALGANSPAVFDLNAACSGFTHALAVADQAIRSGAATTALVIGAEKLSDFTDWTDRTTCVLVGDGAGALVLTASSTSGVGPVHWGSVPALSSAVRIEEPGMRFQQEGMSVFRWAISEAAKHALAACEVAGVRPEELAGFVPHQANLRIIEPLAKQLGIPAEITACDVVTSGNTSSASIPIALAKLIRNGDLPPNAPVLLFGFGGGFAYAGQVIHTPAT
ncbi:MULTISPECIES: beta-ketoacyl-ACP synthase III [Arthrobacter]|uniref:Beta-ketoacyl-[acyl-carrier-protein] synthase III n=1 Tax=Arthrobacter terricola TaxID=2547396 RepID=A0A4R5KHM5_9MICC|nr:MULTISPECIES: beta-ketoacyl-ACP synthase III [Arthrobacter]MBT8159244.1 ketoacyl-ACP synthase III [Arthrobacter sp. GN70]TDF94923.1 ketoacyl-ACP synthase III [Arthrobacter terricola]